MWEVTLDECIFLGADTEPCFGCSELYKYVEKGLPLLTSHCLPYRGYVRRKGKLQRVVHWHSLRRESNCLQTRLKETEVNQTFVSNEQGTDAEQILEVPWTNTLEQKNNWQWLFMIVLKQADYLIWQYKVSLEYNLQHSFACRDGATIP